MAILFVGSEDISFRIDGSYGVSTSGRFPAGLRQSLTLSGATAVTAAFSAPAGTFWVAMSLYKRGAASAVSLARFYTDITLQLALNLTAAGNIELDNGTVLATSTRAIDLDTLFRLDVKVDFPGGHVRVYRRHELILSYDGALGSSVTIDHLVVTNPGPSDSSNTLDLSGVLVQTASTRRASLYTLVPTSLIDATNWTGSVNDLNEQKLDDTTFVTSNTSNAVLTAGLASDISLNVPVRAIIQSIRISGADSAQIGQRNALGSYALNPPATGADSSVPQNYNYVVPTNPFTGAAWNLNDLTGLGFTVVLSDSGSTYLVDQNGNTITDENGNAITF